MTSRYGPYSKAVRLGVPDGRTAEGIILRNTRKDLFDHIGGEARATVPQRMLVERAARLQLQLVKFEERMLTGGITERDERYYTVYGNSLSRILAQLGLHRPSAPAPSLAELFPGRAA